MSDKELKFTGERLIPGQASSATFWEHIYRYRFALNYIKGKCVLDIASGEGYGTAALHQAGAKETIGIDISQEACDYAKQKYGLDYRVGNAQSIPLNPNSLDTIISFETIEHIDYPELFLKECARILKKDGKLILSTPNGLSSLVNKNNEFHTQLFDIYSIKNLIEKHFHNIKVFSQCPESLSFFSLRHMASLTSSLNKFNTYKKFAKNMRFFLRKHTIDVNISRYYKERPIEAILQKDNFLSKYVNPYQVSKFISYEKEIPMFYIFEISNPKSDD